MTEEQYYNYNKYVCLYDEAKSERDQVIACAVTNVTQCRVAQNNLSESSLKKKNLEQRLEDVKEILSMLDGTVDQSISMANRSGARVGEMYCATIHCSAISSANIQTAYYLQGVQQDLHSGSAYQECLREKQRIESSIVELSAMISQLKSRISELTSSITYLQNRANDLAVDMNSYANQANSFL